ncbi:hypothetical protein [Actinorhabdospora filicis]|uniref:hypothetical protein n=1 Tax=Actinorhabdospora filicis TaxID=1785913 RepID=UPI0025556B9F|nr:hypothetical protein [Actinorhabdospora filicis]
MENANTADGHARVGVQANTVHEVTVYQVGADADPKEKFLAGVRYLDGGMPTAARKLIDEAVHAGHTGVDVGFYWVLARLSGRTRRDLSDEDMAALRRAPERFPSRENGQWTHGLRMIARLMETPEADVETVTRDFDHLPVRLREDILRHLDRFLTGPIRDRLWERTVRQAASGWRAGYRVERAWKFFQPTPNPPRPRRTEPFAATRRERGTMWTTAALAALSAAGIGAMLVANPNVPGLVAYALAVTAGLFGAGPATDWRHLAERVRAKEAVLSPYRPPRREPPDGGFTARIRELFAHYFATYVPAGLTANAWRAQMAGIEQDLGTEVAHRYRESRIGADGLEWLVDFLARRTMERWESGAMLAHRHRPVAPARMKALAGVAAAAFIVTTPIALIGAWSSSPELGLPLTVSLALFGFTAAKIAYRLRTGPVRAAEDAKAASAEYAEWHGAYLRRVAELADRPSDEEMAAWLATDKVLLMNRALHDYKLSPADVLEHALLEDPAQEAGRARIKDGPWRYTWYRLMLFILTADGVRQVLAEVNTSTGRLHMKEWNEYGFHTIASAHLVRYENNRRRFTLRLLSGLETSIPVRGPRSDDTEEERTTRLTMDASGVHATLHVLQGVAAEGKEWVALDGRRDRNRMSLLKASLHAMTP